MSSYKRKRGPYRTHVARGVRSTRRRRGGPRVFVPYRRGRRASLSVEKKFHDVDVDDASVNTAGTVTATVNIIAQGVTESERVGRKCTITNINVRYTIVLPEIDAAATPGPGDVCRVIFFVDKQANGAAAAVTDILETADYQSFNNLSNSSRFRVLMDRSHALSYTSMASDGAALVSNADITEEYSFYKECSIPIEFSSTTGAIGEIRSNNIAMMVISRTAATGFFSKWRLRFTDG